MEKIVWAQYDVPVNDEYYRFPAYKTDINFYAKMAAQFKYTMEFFADMQYRFVHHTMPGFEDNPTLFIQRSFNFINPKAGISYSYKGWNAYASYALANKEPNRDDFEAGLLQQPSREKDA